MQHTLDTHLIELRRALLVMSASVEHRVASAARALLDHNTDAARSVKGGDREIDRMDVDIEAECLQILALHQPVAKDLRFVVAALRIEADLERIGDLAKGIAKRVLSMSKRATVPIPEALVEMTHCTRGLLGDALGALSEGDAKVASRVRGADQPVDDLYKAVVAWAVREVAESPENATTVIDLLSVARSLERIGDLSTNIAEAVIFEQSGSIVRHAPV